MAPILTFLKAIAKNNNREWFEKNKSKYTEAKETFEQFVGKLLGEMIKFDNSLSGLNPKKLVFRIYRDVRFSKDKRPYKKNFGAAFSPSGKGLGRPGYYLHIEPGNKSFVAGGLFQPEPEVLNKVRQEIDYNGKKLESIIRQKKFKSLYKEFWDEDKLKTAPKGYEKDHPQIELLKLKSFIVTHQLSDKLVADKKFMKSLIDSYRALKPLNDFLGEAIS